MNTRLLFIVNTVEYGGAEQHLLQLVRRLDASSVHCTILCYGPNFYSQRLLDRPDVHVVPSTQVTSRTFFSYWFRFLAFRPHVIVFVKGSVDAFPLHTYLAARLSGARRIVAIEQLIAEPLPPHLAGDGLWYYLRRVAGWRARHIVTYVWMKRLAGMLISTTICVSNAVRDRLVHDYGYPRQKTVTVPNGVNLNHFVPTRANQPQSIRTSLGLRPSDTIIVCVARLVPRKRIDVLLDAFSLVSIDHPSCTCVLLGSGLLEPALRARSVELGLSATVRFVGFVEDVRPYLESADIYVSPSEKEGLPLALTEAMAYGLPPIVTDISGHNEVVLHGQNGLLIAPGSAEELAKAIKYLLQHKEERIRMGMNARRRVEVNYNTDNTMTEIQHLLLGGL